MRTSTKLFALLFLCVSICSCQKGAVDPNDDPDKNLIIGRWQMSGHVRNPALEDLDYDGIPDYDLFKTYGECFIDNYVEFRADGTGEENEGPTNCDSALFDQVYPFQWSMSTDGKQITSDGKTVDILELTKTKFVYEAIWTESGQRFVDTVSWRRM